MSRSSSGAFFFSLPGDVCEFDYLFELDGEKRRPDPASHFQPEGVHGISRTVDHETLRTDPGFPGIDLSRAVFYELHVGTFTDEGTFESTIRDLDRLVELGITAVEVMPVAAFPGERNWGYDGVLPFAVQKTPGGPAGFHHFIAECHRHNLGVVLDVVYNHMGPEGNYLRDFGPYFIQSYRTPWGDGMNFDEEGREYTRSFFLQNLEHWFETYRVDALRIDAIHGIRDNSPVHILREMQERTDALSGMLGKRLHLISESDLNDSRVIRRKEEGGFGHSAQWSDDFHHCVHTLLTGESGGYYADFGRLDQLVRVLNEGYVYQGDHSAFRGRPHGNSTEGIPLDRFVFFTQNHDQVGNRFRGERLSVLVDDDRLRVAAALAILSPGIPLLFMGEEYGERAPFLYFIDHGDPDLIQAVREGRKKEFAGFLKEGEQIPDPASRDTFRRSRLDRSCRETASGKGIEKLYRKLIQLRQEKEALRNPRRDHNRAWIHKPTGLLVLDRGPEIRILFSLDGREKHFEKELLEDFWFLLDEECLEYNPSGANFYGPGFRVYERSFL